MLLDTISVHLNEVNLMLKGKYFYAFSDCETERKSVLVSLEWENLPRLSRGPVLELRETERT